MTVKTALKISLALALAVGLSQCSKPKPVTYGFDVSLSVTPAAAEKLKAAGQKIEVSAYYFGAPVDAAKEKANEAGEIELGENRIAVAGTDQTVNVPGNVDDYALKSVNGAPSIVVSAYLDPTAGTENILTCTTFKGPLSTAQSKPVAIACDVKS